MPRNNGWRVFNYSLFVNFFGFVNAIEITEDGKILCGTADGLFVAQDLGYDTIGPYPVYLTRIEARVNKDSSFIPEKVSNPELNYRYNSIGFRFSSPFFLNSEQNKYSYRLAGTNDTNWSNVSNNTYVYYPNLAPGNYRFEVRNLGWNLEWGAVTSY